MSFYTGVFPTIPKVAKVVPVYKKDSKLDFSNYGSISLLSIIEEILEKLMYNRVYKLFTKNNFIYPRQFGFRQQHSTLDVLISLTEDFDIRGIANEWCKSYLVDRKQSVLVNGHVSNKASVKYGVPQGSILGPLLFLIHINDLNHALKFCKVHNFADDTNLVYFSRSAKKLNKYINIDMKNLTNWLNANKISLNI